MSVTGRLTDLVNARRRGDLDRDAYWMAMQDFHRRLQEYQQLVAAAGLGALEITSSALRLRLDDGVRIEWDPEDLRGAPVVLLNDGSYEAAEWKVVRALGGAAKIVLDVGANIGWYTVRLASHRGDRPGLHAFEPIPSTFQKLSDNVRLNGFDQRVIRHPFGLSDRDEVVPFYLPKRTGSVAASEQPLFADEAQTVTNSRVRRLDDVAQELQLAEIDFVKCDVEGGEFGFLRGAEMVLRRHRPTILLEMLRKWGKAFGYRPNDIIAWMEARGYRCAGISERSVVGITTVTDATSETNFLFVHSDRTVAVTNLLTSEFQHVTFD